MRRRVPRTRTPPTVPWGTNLVHAGATRRWAACPRIVIGLTLRAWLPTAGGDSSLSSACWAHCWARPGGGTGRHTVLRGQRRKASRFESGPGHPVGVFVRPACACAGRCAFSTCDLYPRLEPQGPRRAEPTGLAIYLG